MPHSRPRASLHVAILHYNKISAPLRSQTITRLHGHLWKQARKQGVVLQKSGNVGNVGNVVVATGDRRSEVGGQQSPKQL